jgi:hypothetical protein
MEKNHGLLRVLMDAVSQTMKRIIAEKKRATPSVICALHPYVCEIGPDNCTHNGQEDQQNGL